MATQPIRRMPIGAEVQPGGAVHFRVCAPKRRSVSVVFADGGREAPLTFEGTGYFSGLSEGCRPGDLYRFRLDGADSFPDPVSRFQPDGPHGPSMVIDPNQFKWSDRDWRGCEREGQVVYEMHIGAFTSAGTWASAAEKLPLLADLGVTILEVMPIADFSGRFGWGYDGVNMFAPTRLYGSPDHARRFVDRAHSLGLGVILDVVYNHIGPDGNYLKPFMPDLFTDRYKNDWGVAINFDGADAAFTREFFTSNAAYWIDEFHFDGLRLDATQQIYDDSKEHILANVGNAVRAASRGRSTIIVAENEPEDIRHVLPLKRGGFGLDMMWNDDYHHSAMAALAGHNEAYYSDYAGAPQEFVSAAKWGFLFQGQRFAWQKKGRGTPTSGADPTVFVNFLENHDQVANSSRGSRCRQLSSPAQHRALAAFTILMPGTPMLFQGEEFGSTSPFLFFADHVPELATLVRKGRADFLSQFPSIALPEMQANLDDPADAKTFARCKLDWSEYERHADVLALYRELIQLRRRDVVLRAPRRGAYDGAVLSSNAFALRFFGDDEGDRLLLVNLGQDLHLKAAPEPLLAAPINNQWIVRWSSEDPRYGGQGVLPPETDDGWRLTGRTTVLLIAQPITR